MCNWNKKERMFSTCDVGYTTVVRCIPGGRGGDSSIKMPGCVCWGFENVPILKDT